MGQVNLHSPVAGEGLERRSSPELREEGIPFYPRSPLLLLPLTYSFPPLYLPLTSPFSQCPPSFPYPPSHPPFPPQPLFSLPSRTLLVTSISLHCIHSTPPLFPHTQSSLYSLPPTHTTPPPSPCSSPPANSILPRPSLTHKPPPYFPVPCPSPSYYPPLSRSRVFPLFPSQHPYINSPLTPHPRSPHIKPSRPRCRDTPHYLPLSSLQTNTSPRPFPSPLLLPQRLFAYLPPSPRLPCLL